MDYEPTPDNVRPIKGVDWNKGTLDLSTGIFTPAENEEQS